MEFLGENTVPAFFTPNPAKPDVSGLVAAIARSTEAGNLGHYLESYRWSVLAQQTLFSPRRYPSGQVATDGWDGYPAARERLLQSVQRHSPRNTVLLGGDINQNYVCNVHAPGAGGDRDVLASEFCGTSISSRAGTTRP